MIESDALLTIHMTNEKIVSALESDLEHELQALILAYVAQGDQERRIVKYLFSVIKTLPRVSGYDISQNGGLKEEHVPPVMSRLRERSADFFSYNSIGRSQPHSVVIPKDDGGNYALQVKKNNPPQDLVPAFWHYHCVREDASVAYPEVQGPLEGGLPRAYVQVVPAALVRSLFRLIECFRPWRVRVTPTGIRPSMVLPDGDLIILGTPATMPALQYLDASAPMYITTAGVIAEAESKNGRKATSYSDTPDETTSGELVKWALLTRHYFRFHRTLTVLAAQDSLAVEALVKCLTTEEGTLMLAAKLRCNAVFPDNFQALFSMRMFRGDGYPRQVAVENAVDLGLNNRAQFAAR